MDVKRKLFDKLREFYNDKNFVVGVMSHAKHAEDQQTIIDYIDNGDDVTIDNIILLSLHLCNARKNTP